MSDTDLPVTHYYDGCGGEVYDNDVFASEPWRITCPACSSILHDPETGESDD